MTKTTATKTATLHRMALEHHTCPYGLKARHLLKSKGYTVEDHLLTTREQVDAFKTAHGVATTPQVFIGGERGQRVQGGIYRQARA